MHLAYFTMCFLCVQSCRVMWVELSQTSNSNHKPDGDHEEVRATVMEDNGTYFWSGVNFTHH